MQVGDVKRSLQCLQSVLILQPPLTPTLEARTHLQLGVLLKQRTKNRDLAKHHVEQAVRKKQRKALIGVTVHLLAHGIRYTLCLGNLEC